MHLAFWLVIWGDTFYTYQLPNFEWELGYLTRLVLLFGYTTVFFYVNYSYLVPRFLIPKKYKSYLTGLVISWALHVFLLPWAWKIYDLNGLVPTVGELFSVTFTSFFFYSVATIGRLMEEWWKGEVERKRLKKEIKLIELLQSHGQSGQKFLFDVLYGLFEMSISGSFATAEAVRAFRGMLEYQRVAQNETWVSVDEEVDYLKKFVRLFKYRGWEQLDFSVTGDATHQGKVPSMLLHPIVEHSLKLGGEKTPMVMDLEVAEDEMRFRVLNTLHQEGQEQFLEGFEQLQRRIDLLFDGDGQLNTALEKNDFLVELSLPLK